VAYLLLQRFAEDGEAPLQRRLLVLPDVVVAASKYMNESMN
jgi:hypothetical protein